MGLIYLEGEINSRKLKILLDTGSEASMIKEELLEDCKLMNNIIKVPKLTLLNANGRKICETNKSVTAEIKFENEIIKAQLLVIHNLQNDVIIGSDEMHKNQIIIDYKESKVKIQNQELKFMSDNLKKEETSEEMGTEKSNEVIEVVKINNLKLRSEEKYEDMNKIDCEEKYKVEVKKLIEKYKGLIVKENRIATDYVHKLEMKDLSSFKVKNYPVPYKYKQQVNEEIQNMLKNKIIEYSNTQYINPLVIVRKANGELRLCLDARNINKCTVPQWESPLSMDAILGRVTEAKWFTKMDLKHSFWLIPLDVGSRQYTGFMVDGVVYQFCVVPYGIQSACSALVKALHKILDKYEHFVLHYVDDLLLFSKNAEEHKRHLEIVLRELDEAGLKINLKKCQFYKKQVLFLGYKLNRSGIQMDEERIKAIVEYKRPTNLKTLRSFLGVVNYFKRLIPDLSEKTWTLMELLRKGVKWKWDEKKEEAFLNLKATFLENLKIYHPRYDKPFILRTDASINKFAGVLLQEIDGQEYPIYFTSRITKKHERNYSVTELELASIIYCIKKLKFYLLGAKFYIETDHAALTTIMNNKYANNRIHRWILLLQEYDFEIRHIPGKSNVVDAFTREDGNIVRENRKFKVGVNIMKGRTGIYSLKEIILDQKDLEDKQKIRSEWKNNVYVRREQGRELYVITKRLGSKIMKDLHEKYGHVGAKKTWLIFRENYICPKDLTIIKTITRCCDICQRLKGRNVTLKNITKSIIAENCLDIVAIDFISDLQTTNNGNKHILVVLDIFSKFMKLYPCKRTNFYEIRRQLCTYFDEIGTPKKCILDNATYFQSVRFLNFCERNGVDLNFTSIRHPSANPAERYIQEVIKFIRIICKKNHKIWDQKLQEIENYLNSVPNTNTKECPIFLMKRERPKRNWTIEENQTYEEISQQVRNRIKKRAEKYIKRQQKKIKRKTRFDRGELVLVKKLRVADKRNQLCAKLIEKYEGPYEIVNENPTNSYLLRNPQTKLIRGVFNIQDICKYEKETNLN